MKMGYIFKEIFYVDVGEDVVFSFYDRNETAK